MITLSQEDQAVIDHALSIISNLYERDNLVASNPQLVKQFCQLRLAHLEHEVFGVLFLDSQHRLIRFTEMFRGTIGGASVHPREVAKEALFCNASALIVTHNHPSGIAEPSAADQHITTQLVNALGLLNITILDHIIVGHAETMSFAERGLL